MRDQPVTITKKVANLWIRSKLFPLSDIPYLIVTFSYLVGSLCDGEALPLRISLNVDGLEFFVKDKRRQSASSDPKKALEGASKTKTEEESSDDEETQSEVPRKKQLRGYSNVVSIFLHWPNYHALCTKLKQTRSPRTNMSQTHTHTYG